MPKVELELDILRELHRNSIILNSLYRGSVLYEKIEKELNKAESPEQPKQEIVVQNTLIVQQEYIKKLAADYFDLNKRLLRLEESTKTDDDILIDFDSRISKLENK